MRKRILSLLLALTLVLSAGVFGVIPALAADSCVSVKADAVTTGEVVAGSLLEIKLTDVFEDTDGHTLTYTLTNAAQFSVQTQGQGRLTLCIRERPRHLYAEGQGDLLGRQRAYSDLYHHGHGSSPRIGRTV